MIAVARQRKEGKEVDRIAQTRADRATSHWWKGVIALEGNVAYDEHRQPAPVGNAPKANYQQQLEVQIQASRRRGVILALPALRDRLQLSVFEKNLVLMSLAAEVNRRYARLYRYLQGEDAAVKTDLPTLDLALRLLCRDDAEWYAARNHLLSASLLLRTSLVQLFPAEETTLNRSLKLADPLINYLLADQPTDADLEALLNPPMDGVSTALVRVIRPVFLQRSIVPVEWSDLVLPNALITGLQYLEQQITGQFKAAEDWGLEIEEASGSLVLLAGNAGTGKTMAAAAVAHHLETPLFTVDLATIDPTDYAQLLAEIVAHQPTVLLVKSAQLWLNRSSSVSAAQLNQFWAERQSIPGITFWSVTHEASVQVAWRRRMNGCLVFPMPNSADRLRLWKSASSAQVPLDAAIVWEQLAELKLNGGEIRAIVQEASFYAAAMASSKVNQSHLMEVLRRRGLLSMQQLQEAQLGRSALSEAQRKTGKQRQRTRKNRDA